MHQYPRETEAGELGLRHPGNASITCQAKHPSAQTVHGHKHTVGPAARTYLAVVRQQVAVQRERKGDSLGADFVSAVVRNIGYRDATLACRLQVNVVHSDTVADDRAASDHAVDRRALHRALADQYDARIPHRIGCNLCIAVHGSKYEPCAGLAQQ